MPKLPSSADVPKVSQQISVPQGAFTSDVSIAAQELQPLAETYTKIAIKQQNRRNTIDRAKRINQYSQEADNELRRLNAESDLSDEETLQEFGGFLATKRQEILQEHIGTEESIGSLTLRLQDIESKATGRAAGISAKLGRDAVLKTFNDGLTALGESASSNPTLENLDQLLSIDTETTVNDLRGAFDPSEEQDLIDTAQDHIVSSATDKLIIQGRIDEVESLLIDGGMNRFLSPEKQRAIRQRIETIRFNRDKELNKLTEREKRTGQLMERGFSQELSEDIAAKDVRVVGPDNFGDFFRVNIATGEKIPLEGQDKDTVLDLLQTEEGSEGQPEETKGRSIEEAAETGTGPFANIQAGISNIVGPFMEGTIFEDTTSSRQQIRTFNQIAKTGLVNNPKFPVAEQNLVAKLLPDPDKFFTDPDTARANLKELKNSLESFKGAKQKQSRKRTTSKRKAELSDQISRLDELLSLMESSDSQAISTQEEVDKLEKGTRFTWEPTGETFEKE